MEATDLELINRVTRRNDTLERVNQVAMGRGRKDRESYVAEASTDVRPMPEDETYAARYHRAFQKKGNDT